MVWNVVVHIIIGLLGSDIFILTKGGIVMALVLVAGTQAFEVVRVYDNARKKIESLSESERNSKLEEFKKDLPVFIGKKYIMNVVYYTFLLLIAAQLVRLF